MKGSLPGAIVKILDPVIGTPLNGLINTLPSGVLSHTLV